MLSRDEGGGGVQVFVWVGVLRWKRGYEGMEVVVVRSN
jgi:hypothetical protein